MDELDSSRLIDRIRQNSIHVSNFQLCCKLQCKVRRSHSYNNMKSPSQIRQIRNVVLGAVIVMLTQRPQHLHYGATTLAFVPPPLLLLQQPPKQQQHHHDRGTELSASKPQRLHDNADGVVYVNDRVSPIFCCGWEKTMRKSPVTLVVR